MNRGLTIDSFAGGGGASLGILWATGFEPDVAINHDDDAIMMHAANHPGCWHITENIWKVDPDATLREATRRCGRVVPINPLTRLPQVDHLHASPDCRHHSKAKGGAPVSRSVRGLADVILIWARVARPALITLENVEEFERWGPLDEDGKPCKRREGHEFQRWARELMRLGYKGDWRQRRAYESGTPTIRRRLYAVFRCDGKPIVWPEPTHGRPEDPEVIAGRRKPWRTAAEIIDWHRPCPSIFCTKAEAKAQGLNVVRPLADKTLARVARGFKRYVLDRAEPFVVSVAHGESGGRREYPVSEPHRTVSTSGTEHAVVTPFISAAQHGGSTRPADAPIHTICANAKDQNQVIAPFLAVNRFDATGRGADEPLPTITANSFIKRPGAGGPLSIVAPHLMTMRNSGKPHTGADEPCHTVTAGGAGLSLVAGFMAQHNGGVLGRDADAPVSTITVGAAQQQPVMGYLTILKNNQDAAATTEPLSTVHAGGSHHGVVMPFVQSYYSSGGQDAAVGEPMRTVPTKARFSPITGEAMLPPLEAWQMDRARKVAAFLRSFGFWDDREFVTVGPYVVCDIGMRMLTPRELARAQGFPESYDLTAGGSLTETAQRHKIGNSVCPPEMEAITRANRVDFVGEIATPRRIAHVPKTPPTTAQQPWAAE